MSTASPAPARRTSILAYSFVITIVVFVIGIAAIALNADACTATSYTLTSTAPSTNWSDTTKWSPSGSYPGQCAGDSATIFLSGFTMNVNVGIANPVMVNVSGSTVAFTIPAGGSLMLATGSTALTSDTFTVNGGTFGVDSAATLSSWQGPITVNSGTLAIAGALTMSGGAAVNVTGGTVNGGGTLTIPASHTANFSGSNGAMVLSNVSFVNNGTTNYSGSTNNLSINSGATFTNGSGANFNLQNDLAILSDNVSSPTIANNGTITKSTTGATTINTIVNNAGTLNPGSGTIALAGGGTHTGAFTLANSTAIVAFTGGTHNINSGASVTAGATGSFGLTAGTLNINTPITVPAMSQSGGTLAGSAAFTTSNGYSWTGGTQDGTSGGSTQTGGSTVKIIPTSGVLTLIGRTMTGNGTWTYNPTGAASFGMTNAAQINLSGGSLDLQSDFTIGSDASATAINITGGTLTKTTGTKTIVGAPLNVNGIATLQPQGTTISFGGGGSIGGTSVTVNTSTAGSVVEFSGGTTNFNGGAIINSGAFSLTGGTLNANSPATLSTFSQSGTSVLSGTQTLTVGTLNWTGGTMSGTGMLIIMNTGFINGSAATTLSGWTLLNSGTMHYAPSIALAINSGGLVSNSGTWSLENNTAITSDLSGGPKFGSNGTVIKSVGGTTSLGVPVLLSSVTLSGGSILQLKGGGQIGGGTTTLTTASDGLEIQTSAISITSAVTFTGSGLVKIDTNGTLTAGTSATIPNVELDATGTLNGSGTLTISAALKWTGGTMSSGLTVLANTATGDLTALTASPTLVSHTLTNNGTITYNPTFAFVFNGGTLNNVGTFTITGNGTTSVSSISQFNNSGTVQKTSGGGTFTFTVPYAQTAGTTNCSDPASTIAFNNGGDSMTGGSLTASNATANIDFTGGSFTIGGGTLSGIGSINLKGAILSVNAATTWPTTFTMSSGTLNGTQSITVPNAATFTWSGGTITGGAASPITINSGGIFNADTTVSSLIYDTRPMVINSGGTVNWNAGANSWVFQSGASVNDSGTFTVGVNATLGNAAAGSFAVNGQFTHNGSGTLNVTLPLNVQTGGTITSSGGGQIAFIGTAGVSHSGNFDAQTGSMISFAGGTHQLNPGAAFSAGSGTYKVSGATLSLATNVTAPNVLLQSGSIVGSGNLTTTSTFTWSGGSMSGTGTTTVSTGTATLSTNILSLSRNLVLSGNTAMIAGANLEVVDPATVTNNATFDIQDGTLACSVCPAGFVNNGTMRKSTVSSTALVDIPISGNGNLDVVYGNFYNVGTASFNNVTIASGAILYFVGSSESVSTISGTGSFSIAGGGTVTVSGAVNLTSGSQLMLLTGATLTLNGASNIDVCQVQGGTINGSGSLTVTSSGGLTGGQIGPTGGTTFNNNGLLINGTTSAQTIASNTTFNGPVTYIAPNATNILTINSGVTVTNNSTFTFKDQNINGTGATFVNSATGTLVRNSGATGTLTFGPFVNNAGTTTWSVGTTDFPNGFQQSAGSTTMSGGNLSSAFGFTFAGGSFTGFGTIGGAVTNGGNFSIANSGNPAQLNVTGNFTQTSGGTLNIKINGTTPGTQYDRLAVSGNVALGGTLTATAGYTPGNGDSYDVLTFGTNAPFSDFATKNLPSIAPPGFMTAAYVAGPPQALRITATTSVADLNVTQSAPSSVPQNSTVTISVTVTNAGPSAATNVVVTDSFTNATFVSASIPGGTCSGATCTLTSLAAGSSVTATFVLNANTLGTITSTATTSSSTFDPNTADNTTASTSITVFASADLSVTKVGPASAQPNSAIAYDITVTNNGPSDAASVSLSDPTPSRLTLTGVSGACTSFPCALGTLTAGQTKSIHATYLVNPGTTTTVVNTASVTSPTFDPNSANNSASVNTTTGCPTGVPSIVSPAAGAVVALSGTLKWSDVGASSYNVYFGPAGGGCNTLVGSVTTTSFPYSNLTPGAQYEWRVEAVTLGCSIQATSCTTFTAVSGCTSTPPALTAPANGANVSSPVTFTWTPVAGATGYEVFAGVNGATPTSLGTTSDTSLSANVGNGTVAWYVVASFGGGCAPVTSPTGTFSLCSTLQPPTPSVVSTAASGQTYDVTWTLIGGASRYEIDEATKSDFSDAVTQSVTNVPVHYQHAVASALAFFYRVRAFTICNQQLSANSPTLRVIILPVPKGQQSPSVNVPAGSTQTVTQIVHVNGFPGGTFPFTATMDVPFLTVSPASGFIPPEGLDFTITANPAGLENGTATGTLILSIISSSASNRYAPNGGTTSSTPVSVNLVTPVSPTTNGTPPANALVIPSVGHLGGANSQWQSDVRVTNAGGASGKYTLTFTPGDGSTPKQTSITVGAGETVALDDIIRNWYGVGVLGDSANGVLTIIPPANSSSSGKLGASATVNVQTVASSRTYNVTTSGTLGQYIPAIPFASFIGAANASKILSLQQVQQNDAYRTNLGLVEAAGKPANVTVTAFDGAGKKLFDFPVKLAANQQMQMNGFLAQQGVTSLSDGRFEVRVTGGDGKVTAYASLVDNRSGDPLLISGVPASSVSANHYVLPGVADLNNGLASWRSDVRIYNAGTSPEFATLTFYPQNNGGEPSTSGVTVDPGEVKQLNAILNNQFNLSNVGGALHVQTGDNSSLVVTGRTYNLASDGSTYGQFIPAVTSADGVAKGGPTLHILQVEDSVRYRTNVGVAEVSGKPATVEMTVYVPNSKSAPTATISLGANEYKQFDVISSLGLQNVYNARVSVKVVGGDGRVTAYGSVIDMTTQDPTYVPAQQ